MRTSQNHCERPAFLSLEYLLTKREVLLTNSRVQSDHPAIQQNCRVASVQLLDAPGLKVPHEG